MDIGKIGVSIVGGVVLFLIARSLIADVVRGTTAGDLLLQNVLGLVVAGGVVIAVLVAIMRRSPGE